MKQKALLKKAASSINRTDLKIKSMMTTPDHLPPLNDKFQSLLSHTIIILIFVIIYILGEFYYFKNDKSIASLLHFLAFLISTAGITLLTHQKNSFFYFTSKSTKVVGIIFCLTLILAPSVGYLTTNNEESYNIINGKLTFTNAIHIGQLWYSKDSKSIIQIDLNKPTIFTRTNKNKKKIK